MLSLIPIIGPGIALICELVVMNSIHTGSYPPEINILAFILMVVLFF
jgi:hypothetical protein